LRQHSSFNLHRFGQMTSSFDKMQMKKFHDISDPKFENGFLVITIDGEAKRIPLKEVSPLLEKALEEGRSNFEISPSGYGIHWPLLDEDISIDGLLGIVHALQWKRKIA
jgi:Protein of unknown function (DUF2442)